MKKYLLALQIFGLIFIMGCENGTVQTEDPTTEDPTIEVVYTIGDTGPGGGFVFYDDIEGYDFNNNNTIDSNEKNLMKDIDKRYLEVAPPLWYHTSHDPAAEWGSMGTDISIMANIGGGSNPIETVGDGAVNTAKILKSIPGETGRAAQLAYAYSNNDLSDWFLPSFGELVILEGRRTDDFGIFNGGYWASNESDSENALLVNYLNSYRGSYLKSYSSYRVRPIRAF